MSGDESLMEALIMAYSKKYNIPPEQARQLLQPLLSKQDRLKELEEFLRRVDSIKPVITSLPDEAKTPASLLLIRELVGSSKGSDEDSLTKAAIIKEILKSLRDDTDSKKFEAVINELRKDIMELKEEQSKRSAFEELRKELEEMKKRFDELQERMSKPQQVQQPSPIEDLVKKIEDRFKSIEERMNQMQHQPQQLKSLATQVFKELEDTIDLAKKYGLIKEAPEQVATQGQQAVQVSPDKLAEELKKYGYEVRKVTAEDLRRQLEEERERLRAELAREFEMDKARMQYATDLIRDSIREVLGPIIREIIAAQRDALRESVIRRMQSLYSQIQQAQQQQAEVGVQAQQSTSSVAQGQQPGEQGGNQGSGQ